MEMPGLTVCYFLWPFIPTYQCTAIPALAWFCYGFSTYLQYVQNSLVPVQGKCAILRVGQPLGDLKQVDTGYRACR